MIYDIEAKAFFAFEVEADNKRHAEQIAAEFLESVMVATPDTIRGYNDGFKDERVIQSEIEPHLDGIAVTRAADQSDRPLPRVASGDGLALARSFIEGFEGDELQEGIGAILAGLDKVAEERRAALELLKWATGMAAEAIQVRESEDDPYGDAAEMVQTHKIELAKAQAIIASARN